MEVRWHIFLLIVGSAIVTLIPRVLPLMVLNRLRIPEALLRWLDHVPVAVMAALLAQELLLADGKVDPGRNLLEIAAAVPAFLTAFITKSLFATVIVGIITIVVLRLVI
ncbi:MULTISPECIES: AzlD domain-containing protein [Paenibacillus]|uniref:AzlD domain-containing protein n=1 Tax=Paenibacillus campinasensis TaxID=66347 RepID=A0A268EN19_9BACL|nr:MULTISPECIES: AzlD domain-containing protein [Paenibacillus]MUG65798.1 AzlD domain-containing protein [Paenibacillus campinasensis]PAD74514.1 branched-chain amino acid ABC transporter [Paenibacillus campinasensis]PAK51600.1 branched-chain amino acid ABC transporter [Paenibacillus sp. 7541]